VDKTPVIILEWNNHAVGGPWGFQLVRGVTCPSEADLHDSISIQFFWGIIFFVLLSCFFFRRQLHWTTALVPDQPICFLSCHWKTNLVCPFSFFFILFASSADRTVFPFKTMAVKRRSFIGPTLGTTTEIGKPKPMGLYRARVFPRRSNEYVFYSGIKSAISAFLLTKVFQRDICWALSFVISTGLLKSLPLNYFYRLL
jgi:hypothetical protein